MPRTLDLPGLPKRCAFRRGHRGTADGLQVVHLWLCQNREFSHEKWWIFPVRYVTNYQRVSHFHVFCFFVGSTWFNLWIVLKALDISILLFHWSLCQVDESVKMFVVGMNGAVGDLKLAAQRSLGRPFLRFAARDRRVLKPPESLQCTGIESRATLLPWEEQPKVAATRSAFALWCVGQRIVAWGYLNSDGQREARM